MTLKEAKQQLKLALSEYYDSRESAAITALVLESVTGLDRMGRLIQEQQTLSAQQQEKLHGYSKALLNKTPVQYVLGKAHFAGLDLFVNNQVLIPRPETEELVQWVGEAIRASLKTANTVQHIDVLDIGTGSGCVALALKQKSPGIQVVGVDISAGALSVARKNAEHFGIDADFMKLNVLDEGSWGSIKPQDIIVSNPPYIHHDEKSQMATHVLDFEPHQALFVDDPDVLIFYRKIADLAIRKLRNGGLLFFEINALYASELVEMLKNKQFATVEIKQDLQGNERMVKCLFKK